MKFPRIITLLLCLTFTTIAASALSGIPFAIPLEGLKWLVVSVMIFFALTAAVMRIGLSDAERAADGHLKFGASQRGRMMCFIMRNGTRQEEKHCCDVFIDTAIMNLLATCIFFAVSALIAVAILETLRFLTVILAIVVFVGLIVLFVMMDNAGRLEWLRRPVVHENAARIIEKIMMGIACAVVTVFCGMVLYISIYLPIASLIELGYTLLGAIGLYFGLLALLPVPLYCLGGKKLILKTEWGKRVCPIVR